MRYSRNRIIQKNTKRQLKNYLKASSIHKPSIKIFEENGLIYSNLKIDDVILKLIVDTGSCYNLINLKSPKIEHFKGKKIITAMEFKAIHKMGNMPMIICNTRLAGNTIHIPFGVLDLDGIIEGVDGLVGYEFCKENFECLDLQNNRLIMK